MNDQYQNSYKQVLTHIACIGRYVYTYHSNETSVKHKQ